MSIKIVTEVAQAEDYLQLEEMFDSITEKMEIFKQRNRGFSVKIEKDIIKNTVKVKGCFLEEHVN
jgi:VIT1/CCC1 family predicted Fe2+/Mn2+ transporter